MQIEVNKGNSAASGLYAESNVPEELNNWLEANLPRFSSLFILVDSNTRSACLHRLLTFSPYLGKAAILEVKCGEDSKSISTSVLLWEHLKRNFAARNALLINLGGGMITDLGGFVASVYKRGITFINIPTSLLGMTDAAIGGKTGINMGNIKNIVGTFYSPDAVFIWPRFLETLSYEELMNGMGEIIKTALVADPELWDKVKYFDLKNPGHLRNQPELESVIRTCARIKQRITSEDFLDKGSREILNFGHTIGHAFETLSFLKGRTAVSHGHAVVLGIICETFISVKKSGFNSNELNRMVNMLLSAYDYYPLDDEDEIHLLETMKHDKKNTGTEIRLTLLQKPGVATRGVICTQREIKESLEYYRSLNGENKQ